MTVAETDVGLKDRREARSVSGVPLASQQGQSPSVIADEHFVWTLIRLLVSRDDGDVTAPTWNEFHEILSGNEAPKPRTVIGYGALFPRSPTDPAVVQEKCNIHPGWHKQSLVVQWLSAMQPFRRWMNYNAAYRRTQTQDSWHICGTACNNVAAKEPWCMLQI